MIFPLLAFFPFNWVEFSWGFHHRHDPMPAEVAQRAERVGRYVLWLRNLDGWQRNSLIGIVAALLPLGLQRFSRTLYPLPDIRDKPLAAEPTANWIFSQLVSVLAEELWIALCLVCLIRTGHSTAVAVILTSTVFGALHFQHRSGAIGTTVYGAVSACLFLWRGSLLSSYIFHYVRNMGAFYWARRITRNA